MSAPASAAPSLPAVLHGNEALLTPSELKLVEMLLSEGQEHLFEKWPAPGQCQYLLR